MQAKSVRVRLPDEGEKIAVAATAPSRTSIRSSRDCLAFPPPNTFNPMVSRDSTKEADKGPRLSCG